jgi:hypothetical protein
MSLQMKSQCPVHGTRYGSDMCCSRSQVLSDSENVSNASPEDATTEEMSYMDEIRPEHYKYFCRLHGATKGGGCCPEAMFMVDVLPAPVINLNYTHLCSAHGYQNDPCCAEAVPTSKLFAALGYLAQRLEGGAPRKIEDGRFERVIRDLAEISKDRGWPESDVPGLFATAAETYLARRSVYGPSEEIFGAVMTAMFPNGLTLDSRRDWVRYGIFHQVVGKLTRYAADFSTGHVDSIHDAGVYAFMLEDKDRNPR